MALLMFLEVASSLTFVVARVTLVHGKRPRFVHLRDVSKQGTIVSEGLVAFSALEYFLWAHLSQFKQNFIRFCCEYTTDNKDCCCHGNRFGAPAGLSVLRNSVSVLISSLYAVILGCPVELL